MINQPLISIITPVYNSAPYISETLLSVINQTYSNWEQILVDDCSSDESVKIIKEFINKDKRIKLLQMKKNSGSGPARNMAIDQAKGKYIAFLDSDDIWHKQKLEIQVKFMEDNKVAFSHTSYGFLDEAGKKIRKTFHVSSIPVTYKMALMRTEISCLTAMYNVDRIGIMHMPNIKRKQDYALWLKILLNGFNSYPLDEELAYYRQRKGSATNNKLRLVHKHYCFLHNEMKLPIFLTIKYTGLWMWNGLKKYYL